jgi:hypothetical protein
MELEGRPARHVLERLLPAVRPLRPLDQDDGADLFLDYRSGSIMTMPSEGVQHFDLQAEVVDEDDDADLREQVHEVRPRARELAEDHGPDEAGVPEVRGAVGAADQPLQLRPARERLGELGLRDDVDVEAEEVAAPRRRKE